MAMTDAEKIALIRLRIADVPSSPLYPLFTDDEYLSMLNSVNGNVDRATTMAAISAAMQVSSISSREVIDDLSIQNDIASNYLKALDYLIKYPTTSPPANLIPWSVFDGIPCKSLLEKAANLNCKPHGRSCCDGCDDYSVTFEAIPYG